MAVPVIAGIGIGVGLSFLFGGDEVRSYAEFNQSINNNIMQNLSQSCIARCDAANYNTTVIIIDSKVNGGIIFDQKCNAKAQCTMNQTAESVVENVLNSVAEQSATIQNSLLSFGGSTINQEVHVKQRIRNQISQVLSSSCSASTSKLLNGALVYVKGGEVKGDVRFTQSGNSDANCAMNNAAKLTLYNEAVAKADQTATILSWLAGILLALGAIIILAILAFVLYKAVSGGKSSSEEESSSGNETNKTNQLTSQLITAAVTKKPPVR